jgi:hypothetical protein
LVKLIQHSEYVLEVLLVLGGRQRVAATQKLLGVRRTLTETVEQIDALIGEDADP